MSAECFRFSTEGDIGNESKDRERSQKTHILINTDVQDVFPVTAVLDNTLWSSLNRSHRRTSEDGVREDSLEEVQRRRLSVGSGNSSLLDLEELGIRLLEVRGDLRFKSRSHVSLMRSISSLFQTNRQTEEKGLPGRKRGGEV